MGLSWVLTVQQIGTSFSETRKLLRKTIGPGGLPDYDEIIQKHASGLVKTLSGFDGDPFQTIATLVGAVITTISYGENVYNAHGVELSKLNNEESALINKALSNIWLVNIFPWRE